MTEPAGSFEEQRLDPEVVAEFYSRHADELRAYLLGLLRNADLASEVAQATFVKMATRGHTARDGSLKAWLFQVAHHEAMDRRRREGTERRVLQNIAWWTQPEVNPPYEQAARSETIEQVRQAIENLPAEQRDVVLQRIYDGKTFADIAQASGKPLGTILTRMRLATQKLTEALRIDFES